MRFKKLLDFKKGNIFLRNTVVFLRTSPTTVKTQLGSWEQDQQLTPSHDLAATRLVKILVFSCNSSLFDMICQTSVLSVYVVWIFCNLPLCGIKKSFEAFLPFLNLLPIDTKNHSWKKLSLLLAEQAFTKKVVNIIDLTI